MKKLLIAIGAVFAVLLLLIVAVVVISSLGSNDSSIKPSQKSGVAPKEAKDTRAIWQDEYYPAVHKYNAEFNAGGKRGSLTVKEARFVGVENPIASFSISLEASSALVGGKPTWLKPKNFSFVVYQDNRPLGVIKKTTFKFGSSTPGITNINMRARGVYSTALSPIPAPDSSSSEALDRPQVFLRVGGFYSGRRFTELLVGVTAPPPPPGLFFGQEQAPVSKTNMKKKKAGAKQKAKAKKAKARKKAKNKKRGQN